MELDILTKTHMNAELELSKIDLILVIIISSISLNGQYLSIYIFLNLKKNSSPHEYILVTSIYFFQK